MTQYAPGTYVKGDVEREASSVREAVALVFDGFAPKPKVIESRSGLSDEALGRINAVLFADEPADDETETPTIPTPKAVAKLAKKDDK